MPGPGPVRTSLKPYAVMPVQQYLVDAASKWPLRIAVIDGDRRFTFGEMNAHSDRLAAALEGMGIRKGDRVGVLAPNCAEFEIAFFGVMKAGAIVTTINSGYREREIAHQLNNSRASVLIVHDSLLEMAEAARPLLTSPPRVVVIRSDGVDPDSFWGLIAASPAEAPYVEIDPMNDLAALPYSSGTTGLSKGVMLTHHNLTSNVDQFRNRPGEFAEPRPDDVVMVHLPLFHIYGMNVLMNPCIAIGNVQVMMGRFDMDEFLGLLEQHSVTALYTVPPVLVGLAQYPGVKDHDLSALRFMVIGAAPLSEELQLRVQQATGVPVLQAYGMTETSPYTNADFAEPSRARPGSVGPAAADTEQKIVDLEAGTEELPNGEEGELLMRGPQVMKGYFDDPESTAETLTEDGWLHTGDIARMDPDGYVWIVDRKKELIKYKGFQVPPAELEGLLLEHEAVADCAVIGKNDVESGEIPKAFVVRKAETAVTDADLMRFVAERVATFKQIREVEFIDAIPKNPSGKILRRVLIERERGG
ncbi:MAG: AMP-binding protein [Chloroflexi bacterium]|nr:AMP-binding protein [Chloroflexota bacterium]